ncbi:hypothetical protein ACFLQ5_03660, partial [Bacteroidota bacterium]
TIYVQGSSIVYPDFHIKKRLHIIGVGIKPTSNYLYGYPSTVDRVYFDTINYISGASGSIIEGMSITRIYAYTGCKNIIIRRNKLGYSISLTNIVNLLFHNNIAQSLAISGSTNVLIMNNIFYGSISTGSTTTIISNNIFINTGAFSGCANSTITNNIFYYSAVTGATFSNFSNNIGYGISTNVLQGSNSGSGNFSADPKFVYKYTGNAYSDLDNYHLQSISPCKNAGTDGTDIGIFGGQYPFPESALLNYPHLITPMIPVMQELIIQNASVPANGTLNFSVKAYKTTK